MSGKYDVAQLIGKTLIAVEGMTKESGEITFICADGTRYSMNHAQDCCESVSIEDVCGEPSDLIGTPVLVAIEATQEDPNASETGMWTFYKFATVKGWVDLRWYGSSNGYYGVGVSFGPA